MSNLKSDNSKKLIIAVLAVAVGALSFYIYQQQKTETVGIKIGNHEISAEISQ